MAEIGIPLVDVDDIKTGRGGGKRGTGERYTKYADAVDKQVDWIKEQIANSKDGFIRLKAADVASAIGMPGKHPTSIYWGLKYSLFSKGVVVTTGKTKKGEAVLVMREKKDGDTLPASLMKHVSKGGSEEISEEMRKEAEEAGEV